MRAVDGAGVTVVGAGVVGLTSALRLAEAGHRVRVVARERLAATTSGVAAAVWFPYRALPYDRVLAWSATSYGVFAWLAGEVPEAGVRLRAGVELARDDGPEPWWAGAVPDLVRVTAVPEGFTHGWRFTAPVVDMSRYLPWLEARLADLGVVPEVATVAHLADVTGGARVGGAVVDGAGVAGAGAVTAVAGVAGAGGVLAADVAGAGAVVVDCAGLGARELVPDPSLTPVRGQVVVVDQVGLVEWVVADDGDTLTYVVPRLDDIVVGGTAEEGAEDMTVDPGTADAILDRAVALVPALASARVRHHKVGLRPARPTVRLDAERSEGTVLVHCYGHGGAGVTLSWGCAGEVAALVGPP